MRQLVDSDCAGHEYGRRETVAASTQSGNKCSSCAAHLRVCKKRVWPKRDTLWEQALQARKTVQLTRSVSSAWMSTTAMQLVSSATTQDDTLLAQPVNSTIQQGQQTLLPRPACVGTSTAAGRCNQIWPRLPTLSTIPVPRECFKAPWS